MEDNKKRYLEKIVKWFVDDTVIDYDNRTWLPTYLENMTDFPVSLRPLGISKLSLFPLTRIYDHCRDTYGLNNDEIDYIWGKYSIIIIDKINNSKSINESVDRKNEYLDKVVEYLVDDTIIDYGRKMISYPSLSPSYSSPLSPSSAPSSLPISSPFSKFIKGNYGLTNDEIDYVWEEYKNIINEKIENVGSINESVDRKNDYLDKVVDFLVEDTEYEIYVNRFSDHSETRVEIWFPSTVDDEPPYDYSIYDIRNWSNGSGWILDGGDDIDNVCSTYNICDTDTIQELYNRYIQKLSIIILEEMELKNGDRINESVGRKNEYLDKIVEYLVDDTIIDFYENKIRYPFHSPYYFPLSSPSLLTSIPLPPSFRNYNKDNYGLTENEMGYVWKEYKNIINEKINNSGSINESVDRRDKYLNKIVDFLMDDTEVGTGWFNPPYYIGNGRSTAGRTGFKSVYLHTFGLLDYTTYSGLDSQLIYFNSFCKNNYGLTEEETKIVWERYMKKLYESYKWGF